MSTAGSVRVRRIRDEAIGGALIVAASVQFGAVVVMGKVALRHGLPVPSVLAFRFGIGAILLAIVLVSLRRPLVAAPSERSGLAALAVFGYGVESGCFFAALNHGTAAAVTLLFFVYPVLVAIGSWALGAGPPARLATLSLALSIIGAGVVVGTGGRISIQTVGVLFALASAATYSAYLVGADRVLRRTNPFTSALWTSAGASLGLAAFALVSGQAGWPSSAEWPALAAMGAATAGAFVCTLAGLCRLGAVRTAIIAATEPLAAALLAWLFLSETVTPGTAVGGALIVVGAVAASLSRAKPTAPLTPGP